MTRSSNYKCAPPHNHTYLAIGQDLASIQEYLSDARLPAAFMFYTALPTLHGLDEPTDYGSGIEYAKGLLELGNQKQLSNDNNSYNTTIYKNNNKHHHDLHKSSQQTISGSKDSKKQEVALQIGLWLNNTSGCRHVVNGDWDHAINKLWKILMDKLDAPTVFIRVGYEFDNPDFFDLSSHTNPSSLYVQAFRHVVHSCRKYAPEYCNERVVFVWHSWAASITNTSYLKESFYPGDDVVDWISLSLFSQFYTRNNLGTYQTLWTILDFAKQHDKPVMIGESTPYGGIDRLDDPWKDWFDPVLQLIDDYDVGMWSFITGDWRQFPMWKDAGFGDARLTINETVRQLWKERVLQNPRFNKYNSVTCSSHDTKNTKHTKHRHYGNHHRHDHHDTDFNTESSLLTYENFAQRERKSRNAKDQDKLDQPALNNSDHPQEKPYFEGVDHPLNDPKLHHAYAPKPDPLNDPQYGGRAYSEAFDISNPHMHLWETLSVILLAGLACLGVRWYKRRDLSFGYEALGAEEDLNFTIEENRTGYGTIE